MTNNKIVEIKEKSKEKLKNLSNDNKIIEPMKLTSKQNKYLNKFINSVKWTIAILVSLIVTLIVVVIGSQITANVVSIALTSQYVLSSDALLIASTSFVTSMIWILFLHLKIISRIYNFLYIKDKDKINIK